MAIREIKDEVSGQTLILDPDIPGQIGFQELVAIGRLAKAVPPNGVVVETGSLFGRSSFAWARNVDPSVTVYCIDPWVREQWIIDIVERVQPPVMPFGLEAFKHYTQGCPNIRTIKGCSPDVVVGQWNLPVDLFFDDAVHDEPGLSRNRDFWVKWIKPGGIFCGDEYNVDFKACLKKTHELAIAWGVPVDHAGFFCWMQRPK
jgi:hypothetical protein